MTEPLGTLSYSHNRPARQTLTMAVGAHHAKLRFKRPGPPERREWRRGRVLRFSARSRSRMLQMFAKTDLRTVEGATFVTLTYHHEWSEAPADWKDQLEEYDRRIRRQHPGAWTVWRFDWQRRGAPHFHLLVFGMVHGNEKELRDEWLEIAGACCKWCEKYMVDVQPLKSWAQVGSYLSRYSAKLDEALSEAEAGRYWGVKGRANRVENLLTVEVTEGEAYRIRRVFRRLIRAANGYYRAGGSRSGVWVRATNQTVTRTLEWARAGIESPGAIVRLPPAASGATDRLPAGTYWSSIAESGAEVARRVGYSASKANWDQYPMLRRDRVDWRAVWKPNA